MSNSEISILKELRGLLARIESEIGDGAQAEILLRDESLAIRVNWWNADLHCEEVFTPEFLDKTSWKDDVLVGRFINYCKKFYLRER